MHGADAQDAARAPQVCPEGRTHIGRVGQRFGPRAGRQRVDLGGCPRPLLGNLAGHPEDALQSKLLDALQQSVSACQEAPAKIVVGHAGGQSNPAEPGSKHPFDQLGEVAVPSGWGAGARSRHSGQPVPALDPVTILDSFGATDRMSRRNS